MDNTEIHIGQLLVDPTVDQTAAIFQVSRVTIHRMINRGDLDSYKFGGSRRIRRESIERIRGEAAA